MEINDKLFNSILEKTENISSISSKWVSSQESLIKELHKVNLNNQELLSKEFLLLASEMAKNGLSSYATKIEGHVVEHLLNAPYDAKKAFKVHKALFAERHEMAMFMHNNLDLLKLKVQERIKNTVPPSSDKIKVFTYWDSQDNLPEIIQLCRKSMEKYVSPSHFELIILNKDNYSEWTSLKKEHIPANISQAHFTDILRMSLLQKWGGFWLDATCLLTEDFFKATEDIRAQEQFLFCYANSRVGNWFIYSKPNNYVISLVLETLLLWWTTNGRLTNYFMTHDMIEMLYWVDSKYRIMWDEMIKTHPRNALALLKAYNQETTPEQFDALKNGSFVHKLTYKYDTQKIKANSALDKLLNLKM